MKKNTIKAFTLVEMLIVIVIIGILIASLMPRMQSAQWRARDVARKNDLAQIQTAIITSQQDRGVFPGMTWAVTGATGWLYANAIEDALKTAGMTQVPWDPNWSNKVFWLGDRNSATETNVVANSWQYLYMVTKRNGVSNAWFVLMAKTEVEWWSNWVTCSGASTLQSWYIKTWEDLKDITTCTSLSQDDSDCWIHSGACKYNEISELRYILLY